MKKKEVKENNGKDAYQLNCGIFFAVASFKCNFVYTTGSMCGVGKKINCDRYKRHIHERTS